MNIVTAVREGAVDELRKQLDTGADPDSWDKESGESILSIAATDGNLEIVKLLLRAGADPDSRVTVTTPIIAAASEGHVDIVDELVHFYAEVDMTDEDGATALMYAAAGGYENLVVMLVDAGASPKKRDRYGNTALIMAAENRHFTLVDVLSPISTTEDVERVKRMLELQNSGGNELSDLLEAASDNDLDSIRSYISRGGNVNMADATGYTPLMAAARFGCVEAIEALVEAGADTEQVDENGLNALGYAVTACRRRAYEYLCRLTKNERRREEAIEDASFLTQTGRWKD